WERAIPIVEALARDHPDVLSYRRQLTRLRIARAAVWARQGEHARAAAEADALSGEARQGGVVYDTACVLAQAAAAAAHDTRLTSAERLRASDGYAARAVRLLGRAHAVGQFQLPARLNELNK